MHYTDEELIDLGLKIGNNVKIHKKVELINPKNIEVGDNVRIDCHSIISAGDGKIIFEGNNHVACGAYIFGSGGLVLFKKFASISANVLIYTATEDYSAGGLNPTTSIEFRVIQSGPVVLEDHVIVGAKSIILPGVVIKKGANVGCLSLIKKDVEEFALVAGIPAKKIGERSRNVLEMEKKYFDSIKNKA